MTTRWMCGFALAVAAAACGSSDTDDDDQPGSADAAAGADAGLASAPDAASSAELATLSGSVVRSVQPMAGGIGHVYIALFTQDPVTSMDPPAPVLTLLIENADMSAANAAIPYQLAGVGVRSEPYYVSAFLDDNMNATPDAAGPDRGDLVSLNGLASPSVTVDVATTIEFDIDLNLAMPF